MYSIGDGQRKLVYNYKAVESIMSEPKEYWLANSLTLYNKPFKNKSRLSSQLIFKKYNTNKEKSSKYFITKNKQLKKLKKEIQTKRLDILVDKALEKSDPIRNYNCNSYKENIKLKNRVLNKTNYKFQSLKVKNNIVHIPKFSEDLFKKNIITIANNFFPERYFNKRDKEKNVDIKSNSIRDIRNKKKLYEEYKKLYCIKFINSNPIMKNNKELNLKRKDYQLISPAIKIFNKTNKNKFFSSLNNEKITKKIDVGLNNMLYIN